MVSEELHVGLIWDKWLNHAHIVMFVHINILLNKINKMIKAILWIK